VTAERDHFPRTPRTVVFEAIEDGRVHELAGDLMRLYGEPLEIYFSATSFRDLGAPRDMVAGFFSSRFSQPTWLAEWKSRHEIDRIPLRRWLLNSLNFYLYEELRRRQRDRRTESLSGTVPGTEAPGHSAEQRFEREVARAVIGEALDRTREACASSGQSLHLEIFMRHFISQEPYELLAPAFGLSTSQCAGHSRTVAVKLRRALAEILVREGADPQDLDREIGRLLESLGR
jgi:DNA-directed RNA polymerase specialized sigma24 family protein